MMRPGAKMGATPHTREWLEIHRGLAPLVVTFPHTGTDIPDALEERLVSPWLARKDTDWWVHRLYDFVGELDATTVRTAVSRTLIDVNRDPSGTSLYPGQATTELCPLTTFDGERLYRPGREPSAAEIDGRRMEFFEPYHEALRIEIERLRALHEVVVLYDAHSIRSRIPRLFDGLLPHFNLGTNAGRTCDPELIAAVERTLAPVSEAARTQASGPAAIRAAAAGRERPRFTRVTDGRFRGGWTVRHHGRPARGVHAIQMELACGSYLDEPERIADGNWPPELDPARAEPVRVVLAGVLRACIEFAHARSGGAS